MADRVLSERYRIVRHLARGGMAEVYLAHDQLLDRPVAVKLLFPELAHDANFVERFRREARAAAGLNHHNIVSVYDFGEDEGSYFIVMEYVEGATLRDMIRSDGPMELSRIVEIGSEVAAALAVAHANGVVHRDVKPGNVLISPAGSAPAAGEGDTSVSGPSVVKVADFGIARAGDPREGLTQTGAVMGTATYLSPEQARGGDIDVRTDVYSLGVVLYEMATGRPPFAGSSPVAIAYQHINEAPQAPSSQNPALPPAFDAIVLQALAKDPADRQSLATEIRAQLLALTASPPDPEATRLAAPAAVAGASSTQILPPLTSPGDGIPPTMAPPLSPTPDSVYRRRRLVLFGVLGLLLVAMVVIIALLSSGSGGSGTATVPRVVDLTVDDAKAAASKAGLTSRVEQQPDRTGDPNRVVDQNPAAGSKVKRSSVVTLVVPGTPTTTLPPRTVTTPERTATTVRPATSVVRPTTAPPTTSSPTTATPTTRPPTTVATTPTT
ncbi:MAG: Stk1 family PASTA domain-containing Ser/Thr kinase [Actinomycetota bacterium]|nr:Stk1 family PASTA domain-containing Ser/Thr kinase [Actinomycetota bacterium]